MDLSCTFPRIPYGFASRNEGTNFSSPFHMVLTLRKGAGFIHDSRYEKNAITKKYGMLKKRITLSLQKALLRNAQKSFFTFRMLFLRFFD